MEVLLVICGFFALVLGLICYEGDGPPASHAVAFPLIDRINEEEAERQRRRENVGLQRREK